MWLSFQSGSRRGEAVEATGERFVVGRASVCELQIRDRQLSRRHAVLTALPDGRARLEDLDSKNGTFVDDKRVREPIVLTGGERVRFGETELTASRQPPEAAVSTAGGMQPRSDSLIRRIRLERSVRRNAIIGTAALAIGVTLALLAITGVLNGDGGDDTDRVGDIVAKVEPSTVIIQARRKGRIFSTGSGWVLDGSGGLLVTNHHVVNGGESIDAGAGEQRRQAEIVATAPCEDIALLHVGDAEGLETLPLLESQDRLRQGQTVIALGFPENASLEAQLTATQGVVSVARTSFKERTPDAPRFTNLVQTDAAINRGNSGGPLVDLASRLVGMNTAVRTRGTGGVVQGQGYAIGVDRIKSVLRTLRAGRSIGWTGFRSLEPGPGRRITVSDPQSGSRAAARFGGDGELVIHAIDGKRMDGTLARYCAAVGRKVRGEAVTLTVRSGAGSARDLRLRLE